ncbi:MAG: NusA antitermination factor [Candidatus Gottesmanbacteria bacterium GW2011_GWA1_48_13]|uniref:Transcription termination/antitermination protein NusA n=1 Tax=Candidatus Gottesmanbacteria bacterium GW2011_GWA1_48_13 TaxID=1618439 RepID=A0A0G1UMD7_9BACT|nr:MAG: NusA antitermination factor [Candidatus Gottesmanbacteria bacterium GW2011_GWA1_48_13]
MANVLQARTEFASALNQVAHERNLDPQVILDTIKQAIIAAFRKDHPDQYDETKTYDVDLNSQSGEAVIYVIDGKKKTNITPPGFGRIAAQTAKQVILQKIREAEKEAVVGEYEKRLGTLVSGMILRFIGNEIIVDIGKAEAIMPASEQVYSEDYHINQRMTFFLDSIRESLRGKEIVVSRVNTGLIKELFKREVPEVASGAVEIRAIARDPGSRSKIAVYSNQSGVDPVGSCVGQKGVRVQAVIGELNGEKIDIVQFSEETEKFIASALSPAAGLVVKIDIKKAEAIVTAPADQLSLAIGREGQNAKLAGKLTGFHIDIKGEKGTSEKKEDQVSDDISTDNA